jgi:hypothetical protein
MYSPAQMLFVQLDVEVLQQWLSLEQVWYSAGKELPLVWLKDSSDNDCPE